MELLACGVVWWSEQQAGGAPKSPKIARTDRLKKHFSPKRSD
jgi:hypothetical protein